jgi:hypothetical protein
MTQLDPVTGYDKKYKFKEDQYLDEVRQYINGTYGAHYANEGVQTFELIQSAGNGTGFTMGNIQKYASRYGKKNGYNRKDLLKIIHYALLQLYVQDKEALGLPLSNQSLMGGTTILKDVKITPYYISSDDAKIQFKAKDTE